MTPLAWREDELYWGPIKVGATHYIGNRWWPEAGGRIIRGDMGHLTEAVARHFAEESARSILSVLIAGRDDAHEVELCGQRIWRRRCRFPVGHAGEHGP